MEDSSVVVDLMDGNEYLIEEWDFDSSLCEENIDDNETKPGQNYSSDHVEINGDKRQGFELVSERPTKQKKTNDNKSSSTPSSSPSSSSSSLSPLSQLISFGDFNPSPAMDAMNLSQVVMDMERFRQDVSCKKPSGRRQPHVMKEHVMAERKRRQRLSERLIALSSLIPGLKKTDKATILEDAIRHLKQLKERVKQLEEEQASVTKTMESVVLVKKSHVSMDEELCSASDEDRSIGRETLPLIEARVSNNDLLIRIHCEKIKGCLGKILIAMEMPGLDIINSFTLPFGNSTLDITVLAKMNNDFRDSVKDVVKNLRAAIAD